MTDYTTAVTPHEGSTIAVPEPAITLSTTPRTSAPHAPLDAATSTAKPTAVSSASLKAATLADQETIARLDNEETDLKMKIDAVPVAEVIPEAVEEEPVAEEEGAVAAAGTQEEEKPEDVQETQQESVPEQDSSTATDTTTSESAAAIKAPQDNTSAVATDTIPSDSTTTPPPNPTPTSQKSPSPHPPSLTLESHSSIAREIARDIAREAAVADGLAPDRTPTFKPESFAGMNTGAEVEAANAPRGEGDRDVKKEDEGVVRAAPAGTGDAAMVGEETSTAVPVPESVETRTDEAPELQSLQALRIAELKEEELPVPIPEPELVVEDRKKLASQIEDTSAQQQPQVEAGAQDQSLDEGVEGALQPTDPEPGAIETDHEDELMETDSTLGDDTTSLTDTINSQNYVYRYENGRRYHAFAEAAYLLPNDEREQERLDGQHTMWVMALGGKLNLAPISKGVQDVLDVATGTGIWALEFADEYPSARVFGTDLSPIQPVFVPPNCSFVVENSEDAWVWDHKFDFIHSRTLGSTWRDWPSYCQKAFDYLKPGGWVEFHEFTFPFECDDGTALPTGPMMRWSQYFNEAAARGGVDMLRCAKLDDDLRAAGFTNLTKRRLRLPFTGWSEDPQEKTYGKFYGKVFDWGVSVGLLTHRLGWTREEAELFLVDVRREAQDEGVHAYIPLYIYYAQKPESTTVEDESLGKQ